MPVTPLSTPLKTEYKPLGLEAFAQPLSQMAAQFDAVAAELEDTDYTLSRLKQDDPEAKSLLNNYEEEADKIAKQLMKDQNYRLAHSKVKRLNKKFAKDMEAQAYKSNYDLNASTIKTVQEMYDKKELDKRDFDNWMYYQNNHFKGTKYDPATGQYSKVSSQTPHRSVQDDIEKAVKELLNMTPTQEQTTITNLGLTSQGAAELTQVLKYKDQRQISNEVRSFLLQSDRFKDAIIDKAKYQFYFDNEETKKRNTAQGGDPMEFSKQVIGDFGEKLGVKIQSLQEALKTAKGDDKIYLEQQLESLGRTAQSYQESIGTLQSDEDIEKYAEQLYKQESLGYFDRISNYGADLVDFNKIGKTLTYRDDGSSAKKKEATKKAQDIGTVNTMVTSVTEGSGAINTDANTVNIGIPGVGTQEELENVINQNGKNAIALMDESVEVLNSGPTKWDDEKWRKGELESKPLCTDFFECTGSENGFNQETKDFLNSGQFAETKFDDSNIKNNVTTAVKGFTLIENMNKADLTIKNNTEEIASLKNKLSTTTNPDEKNKYQTQIIALTEEKAEAQLALTKQDKDLKEILRKVIQENPDSGKGIPSALVVIGKQYLDGKETPYNNTRELLHDMLLKSEKAYNIATPLSKEDQELATPSGLEKAKKDLNTFYNKVNVSTYWPEFGREGILHGDNGWLTDDPAQQWNFTREQKALTARLKAEEADLKEKLAKAEKWEGKQNVTSDVSNTDTKSVDFLYRTKELQLLDQVFTGYKNKYTLEDPKLIAPLEIATDESLEKMTGGISKQHVQNIKDFQLNGTGKVNRVTSWSALDQTYKYSENKNWNLDFYNDKPALSGYTKEGEPIYRYVLKDDLMPGKFHSSSALVNYIKSGSYATQPGKNKYIPGGKDEFYDDNPVNLYLIGEKVNTNLAQAAKQNYTEIYTNAGGDTKDGELTRRNILDNYTSLALVSSPNRKKYHQEAQLIAERLKKGIDGDVGYEIPAIWNENNDGTFTGYGIQYTIKDKELYQTVIEYNRNDEGYLPGDAGARVIKTENISLNKNLAQTLLRNNLFYGAGSESDIPVVKSGWDDIHFVPAFLEKQEILNPKNPSILAPGQRL